MAPRVDGRKGGKFKLQWTDGACLTGFTTESTDMLKLESDTTCFSVCMTTMMMGIC